MNTIRSAYGELGLELAAQNRKPEAIKVLNKADSMLNQANFAYGMTSRGNMHNRNSLMFLQACLVAGDSTLTAKVAGSLKTDLQQQMRYYNSLSGTNADNMSEEKRMAEYCLRSVDELQAAYNPKIQIPGKVMASSDSGNTGKQKPKKK